MEWLTAITKWLLELVRYIWTAFTDFLNDFWIGIADAVLMSVAGTINSIPAPAFLDTVSLGGLLSRLPNEFLYFMSFLPFSDGFSLIASGVAFRMARKLITLFQW